MADEENLELSELEEEVEVVTENSADPAEPQTIADLAVAPMAQQVGTIHDLEALYDIPVQVSAVLGQTTMQVSQLLKLGRGAVVELDRKVGEAIDIYVNNRLVARGEVVVVEDRLGVTMTEIIKTDRS
jgi:flagellar motor switch protein FliN